MLSEQVRHVSLAGRTQRGYHQATREVNDRTHDKGHSLTICLSDLSGSDQPSPPRTKPQACPGVYRRGFPFLAPASVGALWVRLTNLISPIAIIRSSTASLIAMLDRVRRS